MAGAVASARVPSRTATSQGWPSNHNPKATARSVAESSPNDSRTTRPKMRRTRASGNWQPKLNSTSADGQLRQRLEQNDVLLRHQVEQRRPERDADQQIGGHLRQTQQAGDLPREQRDRQKQAERQEDFRIA